MLFLAVFRPGLGFIIVFYHIKVWVGITTDRKTRTSGRPSISSRETEPAVVPSKAPKRQNRFPSKRPMEDRASASTSQLSEPPGNVSKPPEHLSEPPAQLSEPPRHLSEAPEIDEGRKCIVPDAPVDGGFEGTPMSKTGSYVLDEIVMKFDEKGIEIAPKSPPRLPKSKKG